MTEREGLAFAASAAEGLLREGTLDPSWTCAFLTLAETEPMESETWTPGFFKLQHFVCMYLPLRYRAWTKLNSKRNHETEGLLAGLVTAVTERLWRGFCHAAVRGTPMLTATLVQSVLGPANPMRLTGEERAVWGRRYTSEVKALSGRWRTLSSWPRWETMTLHVASFYVPMGIPNGTSINQERLAASQRQLLVDLAPHVHVDVLELIGRWFTVVEAPRDASGLPKADWNVDRTITLAGRAETEFLLLG